VLPYLYLIGGSLAVISAAILTSDKIELLKNPHAHLNCNLNPIVACGSVIAKPQAEAFGFPNPYLGLAGFAAVATIGVAILAGGKFKRWFWLLVEAGVVFAVGFVTWLQFQSIFRINALCPYCMVVWTVTVPIFWYTTLYNLRTGTIRTPDKLRGFVAFIQRHHADILILYYLTLAAVILHHFWYYWKTVI